MSNERQTSALWITMLQAGLLGVVAGLAGYVLLTTVIQAPARAQGPGPGGFQGPPPMGPGFPGGEREIVAQFDKNGDKRLDSSERKAARESLAADPGPRGFGRRGGPGGFGRGGMTPGSPGRKLTPADVKSYPSAALYDLGTLRTVFLQFESADWEQELAAFNNTDVEVPATVIIDGKTYKNVGVHFRGASSYMMVPEGSKRSLNLSFDFVDEKQAIDNYRTLNFLNANGDPTFVRGVVVLRDRAPLHSCSEGELRARGDQRRELGHLRERAAVQQGLHAGLFQEHEGRAMEGPRATWRSRWHGIPR